MTERPSRLGKCVQLVKSLLLVTHMIGVEACVALEVILMIANIQTLGVPIRFSSLPGTVAAAFGIVLIPTLGFIMDRWATSRPSKAKILMLTTSLQLTGTTLIFIGNTVKLLYHDTLTQSNTTWWNVTTTNNTDWTNSSVLTSIGTTMTDVGFKRSSPSINLSALLTTRFESTPPDLPTEEESVQYFAILAMIGYALIDCGYDSSNCFLKTFALSSSPPEDHSNIIVRSILISSMGGCLVTVLGSVGLGDLLTVGTLHDSNAAQCAFLSALCFFLLLIGLTTTLTTGFCCIKITGSLESDAEEPVVETKDEKSQLIVSSNSLHKSTTKADEKDPRLFFASGGYKFENPPVIDQAGLTEHKKGIFGFLKRQKKQIILNIATFFLLGAIYSYEVYVVNFVGEEIYDGDPNAEVTSQEYKNYLKGIETGSSGILIIYGMFVIGSLFQEMLLRKIGWKLEMIIACSGFVAVNVLCAIMSTLWAYYLTCAWTGLYRVAVFSVPFILANKFALEQQDEQRTGVAIAVVASMLPCGFTVCSALMGPLIDLTGNPATPIYYTVVTASLGLITITFLKSEK